MPLGSYSPELTLRSLEVQEKRESRVQWKSDKNAFYSNNTSPGKTNNSTEHWQGQPQSRPEAIAHQGRLQLCWKYCKEYLYIYSGKISIYGWGVNAVILVFEMKVKDSLATPQPQIYM